MCCCFNLDINECESNNGGCSDQCINNAGSFECGCKPGFQFTSDERSCEGNKALYQVHN